MKSDFSAAIEATLAHRETQGFSRHPYDSNLKNFDQYCAAQHPQTDVLSRNIVHEWLEQEARPQRNGIRHKAEAVRMLGKFLVATGKDAYILPAGFIPRKCTFSPYIFTDDDLTNLFRGVDVLASNHQNPYATEIVPVLFRLLYTCGLRPNEGRELKCADINLATGEILIVHNKQKRQRMVVMSDCMLEMCRRYDKRRVVFAGSSEYFFPAHEGRPYSTKALGSLLKQCWRLGNPHIQPSDLPNVRPYDLRHRFASTVLHKWLDEGKNLYAMLPYLRAFMGHEEFESTAYYIHLLPENLVRSAGIDWESLNGVFPEVAE